MKKLSMLATTAVLLVAATAPSLAATRVQRPVNDPAVAAYPYTSANGAYARAPLYGEPTINAYPNGGNLPFSDRPYGDPDRD